MLAADAGLALRTRAYLMRSRFQSSVLAAVAAIAVWSPAGAQILNSERIEQTFGSYGIEVIASEGSLRLSNLYSTCSRSLGRMSVTSTRRSPRSITRLT
jgi:hypothetical protein